MNKIHKETFVHLCRPAGCDRKPPNLKIKMITKWVVLFSLCLFIKSVLPQDLIFLEKEKETKKKSKKLKHKNL